MATCQAHYGWGVDSCFPSLRSGSNFHSGNTACLIAAINSANSNNEADPINLTDGSYVLTTVNNTNNGAIGLPSITSPIIIIGRTEQEARIVKSEVGQQSFPSLLNFIEFGLSDIRLTRRDL